MKSKIALACIGICLVGCGREIDVSFNKSVGDRDLAEQQVRDAINTIGDYTYDLTWSDGDLTIKLPSSNDLSRTQAEELGELVYAQLVPEDEMRPILDIEITETDEEILSFLELENGEHFSTSLIWERASSNVYYSERSYGSDSRLGNYSHRDFICMIRVNVTEPLPALYASYSLGGIDIPVPVGRKISISNFDQDFLNEVSIDIGTRYVDFIIGDLGSNSVNKHDKQLEMVLGTNSPSGANRADCNRMIASKTSDDLKGLLPSRAAKFNISETSAR